MKNEKLMRAMGEIDEDLIAEAHEQKKPRVYWARWSALAAGLVLLVVSFPLLGMILMGGLAAGGAMVEMDAVMEDIAMGGRAPAEKSEDNIYSADLENGGAGSVIEGVFDDMESPEVEGSSREEPTDVIGICHVGITIRAEGMALTNMGIDGAVYRMNVKKSDDRPLVLKVIIVRKDGAATKTFSSDGEGKNYFSFTVNGENADALPCEAGAYDIVADLSQIFDLFGEENAVLVLVDGIGFLSGGEV